jgi:hypothetical protein
VVLPKWEADAFLMIVDTETYSEPRYQLSYALRVLAFKPSTQVIDGFQRCARKLWKPSAGTDR